MKTSSKVVDVSVVARIVATVLDASDEERAAGLLWYRTFGRAITSFGTAHEMPSDASLALFACLSPLMQIKRNWDLFRHGVEHKTLDRQTGILPNSRRKAEGLLKGTVSVDGATKGMKVSRFYRNLSGDESVVTVDRHAACAAWGVVDYKPALSCREYRDLEACYQVAAAQLEMTPAQCQAIAWIVWRRQQGIKDNGGMELVA